MQLWASSAFAPQRPATPPLIPYGGPVPWMGYAVMHTHEMQGLETLNDSHRQLVGKNLWGGPVPQSHVQTHDADGSRLPKPVGGNGATETGHTWNKPSNGMPVTSENPVDDYYKGGIHGGTLLPPGKNDGMPRGVSLHAQPQTLGQAHIHPHHGDPYGVAHISNFQPSNGDTESYKNTKDHFYLNRLGTPPTASISVPAAPYKEPVEGRTHADPGAIRYTDKGYWTLLANPNPGAGQTPPVSPTSFSHPPPGVTDHPPGPPGPGPHTYPAGPDFDPNRPW